MCVCVYRGVGGKEPLSPYMKVMFAVSLVGYVSREWLGGTTDHDGGGKQTQTTASPHLESLLMKSLASH